jgi:hypothetical protein
MSGEPNYLTLRDAAYWESRSRHRPPPGPRPNARRPSTIDALGLAVVRALPASRAVRVRASSHSLGADASSDMLRQRTRCTSCGSKGGTLQHPGWADTSTGFQPFPVIGISTDQAESSI